MRRTLPPLRALRDFEVAGRAKSLSGAARALAVTPAAVSRQISLLEAHLGCKLFVRHARGLDFTDKGRAYFEEIAEALDRIDRASARLRGDHHGLALAVHVYTTFATEWLVPRINDFRERHPGIELRLTTSVRQVDLEAENADLGVHTGRRDWPGYDWEELFRPQLFPVCSRKLMQRGPPLRNPRDLRRHTLLYSPTQLERWRMWLAAAGVEDIDPERGLRFDNAALAYRAAREGVGVALGQSFFMADDLTSGRLLAPFGEAVETDTACYLVWLRRRADAAHVAAFRAWLLAEARRTEKRARDVFARCRPVGVA